MPVEESLITWPVVIIAAHPDDETVGAGGFLPRLHPPWIVTVTDGSPRNPSDAHAAGYQLREDYARARRQELLNALDAAGVSELLAFGLNRTDQEVSLGMAELARRIASIFRDLRPGAVLTHPYEGGHPDHDATAFAVHAACALSSIPPKIYEFTSYHAASRNGDMEVGRFLIDQEPGEAVALSNDDRERKARMIECFASQLHMLRRFPVDIERFRDAPAYDFTQPPHTGKLFYENFDWGMTGPRWRQLAAEALRELGIPNRL